MNNHEFDDIIKQKSQEREAEVPADIWENITKEKKKKSIPFFWLTCLFLMVTAITVVWNLTGTKKYAEATVFSKARERKSTSVPQKGNSNQFYVDTAKETLLRTNTINPRENRLAENVAKATHRKVVDQKSMAKTARKNGPNVSHVEVILSDVYQSDSHKKIKKETALMDKTKNTVVSSKRNKKKIKGNAAMQMTAGEMDSFVSTTTQLKLNDEFDDKSPELNNTFKSESPVIQQGNSPEEIVISEELHMKGVVAAIPKTDSSQQQKTGMMMDDSSAKHTEPAIMAIAKKEKNHPGKWMVEAGLIAVNPMQLYASPLQVTRSIHSKNLKSEFVSDHIKSSVEAGTGFSMSLVKQINKKWLAGAGFQYLRFTERLQLTGIETNTNYTIIQRVVDNPNGPSLKADTVSAVSKTNTTLSGRNIYNNFSIPLFVRYAFLHRSKWSASFSTGITFDFIRNYKNNLPGNFETNYRYGSNEKKSGATTGISFLAGLHFSGAVSKKYTWFAATSFGYSPTSYNSHHLSFHKKINLAGLSVGLAYKLK